MTTIYTSQSRAEVKQILGLVPGICAGNIPDSSGVIHEMQIRLGTLLLDKIQDAFVAKARGGTDEAGESWPKLKRATIANRRPAPRKKRGVRPRGLLTAAQDKRWRLLYSQALRGLSKKSENAVGNRSHAAAYAWMVLKAEGAKTKLAVYGDRRVEMLRDTGSGLNSLSPGADGNVFKADPGSVIVGTNVKYMAAHHNGVPGKLPKRRLWPEALPGSWWEAIIDQARQGMIRLLTILVR